MSDGEDGGAPSEAEEFRASEIRALELKLQIALAEKAVWETRAEVAGRSAASPGEPSGVAVAKVYLLPREFTDVSTAGLFPLDGEGAKGAPHVLALTGEEALAGYVAGKSQHAAWTYRRNRSAEAYLELVNAALRDSSG